MTFIETAPDRFNRFYFATRTIQVYSGNRITENKILDLGSSENILSEFLGGCPVVQLDIHRSGVRGCYVQGLAESIPFPDGCFDFTACLDVLEHVTPTHRPLILREIARVTSGTAILAFPIDHQENIRRENDLAAMHRKLTGEPYQFLLDHREHGLVDWKTTVTELDRYFTATQVFHSFPTELWFLSHLIDYTLGMLPKAEALRLHAFRCINRLPVLTGNPLKAYRTFIIASHRHDQPIISADALHPPPDTGSDSEIAGSICRVRESLQEMDHYARRLENDVRLSATSLQQLETHCRKMEEELQKHETHNSELTVYRAKLENELELLRNELNRVNDLNRRMLSQYNDLEGYCLNLEKEINSRDTSLIALQEHYTRILIHLMARKPLQ